MIDGSNTDTIIGVDNINNAAIAAENVDNTSTDAENTDDAAINADNTNLKWQGNTMKDLIST